MGENVTFLTKQKISAYLRARTGVIEVEARRAIHQLLRVIANLLWIGMISIKIGVKACGLRAL